MEQPTIQRLAQLAAADLGIPLRLRLAHWLATQFRGPARRCCGERRPHARRAPIRIQGWHLPAVCAR